MPLRQLNIRNFKCFVRIDLTLAPLTVLTGFNAAGKSTALQTILLIAQSLRMGDQHRSLPLNGDLVRLGTAGDIIAEAPEGREIGIEIVSDSERISWQLSPAAGMRALGISRVVHSTTGKKPRTWKHQIYRRGRQHSQIITALKGVVALSAVRLGPVDAFPAPDQLNLVNADVGDVGQFAPWWYVAQAEEDVAPARRHAGEQAPSLSRQLDAYLSELFPTGRATADEIPYTSLIRLALRTGTTGDWRRPANIGYGFTYAFPILVALLLAKPDQILIIDSPEAHLHPSAQSRLGSILAKMATSGLQIFVETHSDHVVNGVRIAVREQTIDHSNIAIHFFGGVDNMGRQPGIVSPKIGPLGDIEDWPHGFFDQIETDLARL